MRFKDIDAYMGITQNAATGQIEQIAELYPVKTQKALMYGFSAMSIVTCQYYLAEINHQMRMINQSIDKILEFLYGDKKAELLSEISFARYAYQNFASIMEHDAQRIATLQSVQEGRRTAMKDIEFYLADLYSTVHGREESEIEKLAQNAFRIKECLELSMQLYVMGNVLEVYYSQNYDQSFLRYVEADASAYITKCEKQMIGDFNALRVKVETFKPKLPGKKINKEPLLKEIDSAVDYLGTGEEPRLKKELHKALYSSERAQEYCLTADGKLYLKRA